MIASRNNGNSSQSPHFASSISFRSGSGWKDESDVPAGRELARDVRFWAAEKAFIGVVGFCSSGLHLGDFLECSGEVLN